MLSMPPTSSLCIYQCLTALIWNFARLFAKGLEGQSLCPWARGSSEETRLRAGADLEKGEEMGSFSASVDELQSGRLREARSLHVSQFVEADAGIRGHAKASKRHASVQAMRPVTTRRDAVPPPEVTRDTG